MAPCECYRLFLCLFRVQLPAFSLDDFSFTHGEAALFSAVAPYYLSDWEKTTYYSGISPDPPELLYRSDLLQNPFPVSKGRHFHLPTKTVHGVFNTQLNAVWDTVAPDICDLLKKGKIFYSAVKAARGTETIIPVLDVGDSNGEPCLTVMKDGNTTDLTV
jgi:hypothetical protein